MRACIDANWVGEYAVAHAGWEVDVAVIEAIVGFIPTVVKIGREGGRVCIGR